MPAMEQAFAPTARTTACSNAPESSSVRAEQLSPRRVSDVRFVVVEREMRSGTKKPARDGGCVPVVTISGSLTAAGLGKAATALRPLSPFAPQKRVLYAE